MIADYMFWLCGGSEHGVSKLIKLYWQVKMDAQLGRAEGCSKDHGRRALGKAIREVPPMLMHL